MPNPQKIIWIFLIYKVSSHAMSSEELDELEYKAKLKKKLKDEIDVLKRS